MERANTHKVWTYCAETWIVRRGDFIRIIEKAVFAYIKERLWSVMIADFQVMQVEYLVQAMEEFADLIQAQA